MNFYESAIAAKDILEQENKKLQRQIDKAPPGILYCSRDSERHRDRWDIFQNGERSFLSSGKRDLAEKLAVKRLNVKKLADNSRELKALEAYLRHHRDGATDAEKLLQKCPAITELIVSMSQGSDWMKKPYKKNKAYQDSLTCKAPDGQMVRSKSEAEIITVLIELGIPYRYECALSEDGQTYYPDFTLWLPEYDVTRYWEHLGRMDDPAYRKEAFNKIGWYVDHGIIPQENLILTYETKDCPFTIVKARNVAKYYFG